MTDLALKF